MMNNHEFIAMLEQAAESRTLYVLGGIGAPAGYGNNRKRFSTNYDYNKDPERTKMIKDCPDDTFFFDCVCLGKAILWGWNGDPKKVYGGAVYGSNNVPDFGTEQAIKYCRDVSSDFSKLTPGEWLYMPGHIGYYVGGSTVIECTPKWKNGVQHTSLTTRNWVTHGKLKYIEYIEDEKPDNRHTCPKCGHKFTEAVKSVDDIAREVIAGKWGVGVDRINRLRASGYNYIEVQKRVNELCM